MELAERLASELTRMPSGCLVWTGCTIRGYGQFTLRRVCYKAHRMAWELAYGPIPKGKIVRHYVCDNPPCCEPTHLRLGTNAQNSADMAAKGRARNANMGKAHCVHGHEFTGANTIIRKSGARDCKTCHVAAMARYYLRKKALEQGQ